MKKYFLLAVTALGICGSSNAQTWETIGAEGFTSGGVQYGCLDVYNGTPYVAFKDLANSSKCTAMRYNGTDWVFVGSEAFTPGIAREQSIAIDQMNGDIYLEYSDATQDITVVSKYNDNNGMWEPTGPNGVAASPADFYKQIKIDNGTPYLVYGGYAATLKKYTPGSPTGTWDAIPGPVISFAQALYTRMAVDGNDQYVIYSDISNQGKATVAQVNSSGVIAVGGSLGFTAGGVGHTDITIDNGTPYISFQDSLNGRKISVMKFDGTSWDYVGAPGISGANVEKTRILVHNSIPYIAYHDDNDGSIHVKKYENNAWSSVGSVVVNGSFSLDDMVIDGDVIFVAYNENTGFGGQMTVKKYDMNNSSAGIDELSTRITISPNPVRDQLTIQTDGSTINKIEILNFSGKTIRSLNAHTETMNVERLDQGIYWLRIYTDSGVSRTRFVKH